MYTKFYPPLAVGIEPINHSKVARKGELMRKYGCVLNRSCIDPEGNIVTEVVQCTDREEARWKAYSWKLHLEQTNWEVQFARIVFRDGTREDIF